MSLLKMRSHGLEWALAPNLMFNRTSKLRQRDSHAGRMPCEDGSRVGNAVSRIAGNHQKLTIDKEESPLHTQHT